MNQIFRFIRSVVFFNIYTKVFFFLLIPIFVMFILFLGVDAKKGTFLYTVKTLFLTAIYPIQKLGLYTYDRIEYVSNLVKDKSKLIKENETLKEEIDFLRFKIVELKNKEIENSELKKLLKFIERNKEALQDFHYITGKVIGVSPDNLFDFVVINLGRKDGVDEGDIVISEGYLAGIVNQVGEFSSSVLLVSNRNFKFTVRLRKTREISFFHGLNENYGILKYVRPEQDIRVGDVVETAGFNTVPSGIPIGIVDSVSYVEGNFFKEVKVRLFFKPTKLEYVLVIVRNKNEP